MAEQDVEQLNKTVKLLDTLIGESQYMAGEELTIADIAIGQTTSMLAFKEFKDVDECANVVAWYERILQESTHFKETVDSAYEDVKNYLASQPTTE